MYILYMYYRRFAATNESTQSKLENAAVITCNSTNQVNDLQKDIDLQLKNHLREIFDCMICRQLSKSPISIATCCKQLLGYSECVERWDRGTCPHCRSEIYETVNVNVFQSILNRLQFLHSHFSLYFFAQFFHSHLSLYFFAFILESEQYLWHSTKRWLFLSTFNVFGLIVINLKLFNFDHEAKIFMKILELKLN